MKTTFTPTAAFLSPRLLIGCALCLAGLFIGFASFSKSVTGTIATTPATNTETKHHHYQLIDLGTFGGPASCINEPLNFVPAINGQGITVGTSATAASSSSTTNPTAINCSAAPNVYHGFEWQNGSITDLGSLGGADYSSDADSFGARTLAVLHGIGRHLGPPLSSSTTKAARLTDGVSDQNQADLTTYYGYCEASDFTGRWETNGECVSHNIVGFCYIKPSANCPNGRKVHELSSVSCGGLGSAQVDLARPCSFQGD